MHCSGMRGAVLVMCAGCSSMFMTKAPLRDPGVRPVECSSSGIAPTVDVVGAIAFGLVSVLGFVAATDPGGETDPTALGITVGVTALGIAGLYGWSAKSGSDSATRCERYQSTPAIMPRDTRGEAWKLTQEAAAAARAGDCDAVLSIDPKVRELDAQFHATVFMRDVAIARCTLER